ncbi:hypothetical protein [Nesterenkonia sandarakina]|uniref:Uncharacterized protein n=1 Tax=Nesterenkonia sandarakina TaxID=272918 RepID=A0A7Z0J338_9MICC|nr:hypothetical protein [Nesterenkonia sandarakina]NYJ16912.1 hypothetical protein [Nesterenkonia sandarakina]
MEPNRYVLKGRSLARLGAQALAEYGPQARIVSAERILQGGIGGFLAREHFEAVVEVPCDPRDTVISASGVIEAGPGQERPASTGARSASPEGGVPAVDSRRRRRALEQHRRQEVQGSHAQEEDLEEDFARMMDELWLASRQPSGTSAPPPLSPSPRSAGSLQTHAAIPAPPGAPTPAATLGAPAVASAGSGEPAQAPSPLRAPGSLIVIACLGVDPAEALAAFTAAADLGTLGDPLLVDGNDLAGRSLRDARQAVLAARAQAVATQVPVLATTALRFPSSTEQRAVAPPLVSESDQLWAAVDLRRKPEDLRHWLDLVDRSRPIDALLLTGAEETLSPETGHQLGWPVSVRMKPC